MVLNLDTAMTVCLDDTVTSQELKTAVDTSNYEEMGEDIEVVDEYQPCAEESVRADISENVCFAKKANVRKTVMIEENPKSKTKKKRKRPVGQKQSENEIVYDKIQKGNKVRKYTKEMQNRDAITKKAYKMRKQAASTVSDVDDKFATAAIAPTRKFDKIIYNSATTDDAIDKLEHAFADVTSDVMNAE